jgi:hypothetical protein
VRLAFLQVENWQADYDPCKSLAWQISATRARVVLSLEAAWHHTCCPCNVKVMSKPKMVIASKKCGVRELVLVPLTANISFIDPSTAVSLTAVSLGCLVSEPKEKVVVLCSMISCPGDSSSGEKDVFINPFWFVSTTNDAREVNCELTTTTLAKLVSAKDAKAASTMMDLNSAIPTIVNTKALNVGDQLWMLNKKAPTIAMAKSRSTSLVGAGTPKAMPKESSLGGKQVPKRKQPSPAQKEAKRVKVEGKSK